MSAQKQPTPYETLDPQLGRNAGHTAAPHGRRRGGIHQDVADRCGNPCPGVEAPAVSRPASARPPGQVYDDSNASCLTRWAIPIRGSGWPGRGTFMGAMGIHSRHREPPMSAAVTMWPGRNRWSAGSRHARFGRVQRTTCSAASMASFGSSWRMLWL
jgi:hypothetical protein